MQREIKIDGMMCGHCEAHVKNALTALNGVEDAVVSHEKGNAIITMTSEISDEIIKKTVGDAGYTVTEIQ